MFNQYQSALRHPRSMTALLLACLWLFAATCQAADPAWQGVWSGTIGKADVTVCLDGNGSSAYYYKKYKREIALERQGDTWIETADGVVSGIWMLNSPQGNIMEGKWRNARTQRELAVYLKRMAEVENSAVCKSSVYQNDLGAHGLDVAPQNKNYIPGIENVRDIVAMSSKTCALLANGDVKCWWLDSTSQKLVIDDAHFTDVDAIAAAGNVLCAVLQDKTVNCSGTPLGNVKFANFGNSQPIQVAISPGAEFVCVLGGDGRVQCAGNNQYGQLGDGTTANSQSPVFVQNMNGVKSIALNWDGACVILNNGYVICWGEDILTGKATQPYEIPNIRTARSIIVGDDFACVLVQDGTVKCWGKNDKGQLGAGAVDSSNYPKNVVGFSGGAALLKFDLETTCGALQSGSLECWGGSMPMENKGHASKITSFRNVMSFTDSCAVAPDKTVWCIDYLYSGSSAYKVVGLAGVMKLVNTNDEMCALLSNGYVKCWKSGRVSNENNPGSVIFDGEILPRSSILNKYKDPMLNGLWRGYWDKNGTDEKNIMLCLASRGVSSYYDLHDRKIIPLKRMAGTWLEDSTIRWRLTSIESGHLEGIRTDVNGESNFNLDRVYLGPENKAAECDGEIYIPGQLKLHVIQEVKPAQASTISIGSNCVVMSDGKIMCWGLKYRHNFIPAVMPGITDAVGVAGNCVLLRNGTVRCLNVNYKSGIVDTDRLPTAILGVTGAISLISGDMFYCALLNNGKVQCWGDNYFGQFGNGSQTSSHVFQTTVSYVAGLNNIIGLSAHRNHACALSKDDKVYCWGNTSTNDMTGQVYQSDNHNTPIKVDYGIGKAVSISSGDGFDCAVLIDHRVTCWDGLDFKLSNLKASDHLSESVMMATEDPSNMINFLNLIFEGASQIRNVVSLSAGDEYVCALLLDGTVACWGKNSYGVLGDGTLSDSGKPRKVVNVTDAVAVSTNYLNACALIHDGNVKCWGALPLGDGAYWEGTNDEWNTAVTVTLHSENKH